MESSTLVQPEGDRTLEAIDPSTPGRDVDFSLMPELLAKDLRPYARCFGQFVRMLDGIVETPFLSRDEKFAHLAAIRALLAGEAATVSLADAPAITATLRDGAERTGASPEHAHRILQAAERDVSGGRVATWSELLTYCQFAAAPFGRYLLELHGEDVAVCGRSADALSCALLILKRMRDCKNPAAHFNRLCIPEQFMRDAFITTLHLQAPSAKGQTRAVIDRVLDGVDRLLGEASPLPDLIRSTALGLHTAITLCRARKLAARFRFQDPLNERIGLTRWERLRCRWTCRLKRLARRA